jgi:hypothetical protein
MPTQLSELERRVTTFQASLIDKRAGLAAATDNAFIKVYAEELARHYFPRSNSDVYLEPIIKAFSIDLVLAPLLHATGYLWRYNYDDLDLLSNFYRFTNHKQKYFHLATGILEPPTREDLARGCDLFRIDLDTKLDEIFDLYQQPGLRSRLAARTVETLAGAAHDHKMNAIYGFYLDQSKKNLRASKGLGKFRYLRKGKHWLALGTAKQPGTINLRETSAEAFGYEIAAEPSVKIKITDAQTRYLKETLRGTLSSESPIYLRIRSASTFYKNFYEQHKFSNNTDWTEIDKWLGRRVSKAVRAYPKTDWNVYQASKHRQPIIFPPKRTNFFWRVAEELNCPFKTIWSPYNW